MIIYKIIELFTLDVCYLIFPDSFCFIENILETHTQIKVAVILITETTEEFHERIHKKFPETKLLMDYIKEKTEPCRR